MIFESSFCSSILPAFLIITELFGNHGAGIIAVGCLVSVIRTLLIYDYGGKVRSFRTNLDRLWESELGLRVRSGDKTAKPEWKAKLKEIGSPTAKLLLNVIGPFLPFLYYLTVLSVLFCPEAKDSLKGFAWFPSPVVRDAFFGLPAIWLAIEVLRTHLINRFASAGDLTGSKKKRKFVSIGIIVKLFLLCALPSGLALAAIGVSAADLLTEIYLRKMSNKDRSKATSR